jgi:hypothetical protein
MERRWGNRLVSNELVRVTRDRHVLGFARLQEVSLSGAFLKAAWHLPSLTRICLHVPHGGNRHGTARVEAFVVRQGNEGLGVEWCDFAPPAIVNLVDIHQPQATPQKPHTRTGHRSSHRRSG